MSDKIDNLKKNLCKNQTFHFVSFDHKSRENACEKSLLYTMMTIIIYDMFYVIPLNKQNKFQRIVVGR